MKKLLATTCLLAFFLLALAAQDAEVQEEEAAPSTDPFEQALNTTEPAETESSIDPFAAALEDSTATIDPFAAATDPFSAALDDSTSATDPFADAAGKDGSETAADPFASAADETGLDWDSLFADEDFITIVADPSATSADTDSALVQETLKWGGTFRGTVSSGFGWENPFTTSMASILDPDSRSLSPSAGVDLYFSARPATDYRVYGKFKMNTNAGNAFGLGGIDLSNLNFATNDDGSFTIGSTAAPDDAEEDDAEEEEEDNENTASNLSLSFSVYELFADFSWKDKLFLRFGKAQIAWGVGYFFSPADVLNLTAIDAEDPTADRSGPLNLKLNYPIGINNLDLFLVTDKVTYIEDIAVAPRFSFVLGGSEIGVGAYWQRDLSPRLVSTLSTSWKKFSIFAEAVAAWGSDRVYVRPSRIQPEFAEPEEGEDAPIRYTALDTFKLENQPFVQATGGFLWQRSDPDLTAGVQYFFNGPGYPDSSLREDAVYLLNNPDTNGLAISDTAAQPDDYEEPPALRNSDLNQWGQHYAALSLGWNGIADSDLSASAFLLMNLSDLSGIANLSFSYRFFSRVSASIGGRLSFGPDGGEYTNPAAVFGGANDPDVYKGPLLDLTIDVSLGGGSF
ncbi:MAG: hypothetical protein KKI09_04515 [Spirochaetes bacterium]|nr:hypothetical protein [Spirochaetota bacterium]MBU0954674.1 hypothetical protein [Spirochaetota bacterium]